MTENFYNSQGAYPVRGIVNKVNATHQEPTTYNDKVEPYNPFLAQFSAAWIKLYLNDVKQEGQTDFDALIHGSGPVSLCGGGDGAMEQCEVRQ